MPAAAHARGLTQREERPRDSAPPAGGPDAPRGESKPAGPRTIDVTAPSDEGKGGETAATGPPPSSPIIRGGSMAQSTVRAGRGRALGANAGALTMLLGLGSRAGRHPAAAAGGPTGAGGRAGSPHDCAGA